MKKLLPILILCGIFAVAIPVLAETKTIIIDPPLKHNTIVEILGAITSLLVIIAISLGVIMIIWAGIQYMTAGGSEEKIAKAKKTILYTIIGVAIVLAADFIIDIIKDVVGVID